MGDALYSTRWSRGPQIRAMTPLNPHQAERTGSSGFVTGLTIGLVIGLSISCLGGGLGFFYVKREAVNARNGWNLVPVVVAAQDITADTIVTYEMISQRSIPEQFVTSSVVKPDSASFVVNQKVLVPLQAGDPLLWSQFETGK